MFKRLQMKMTLTYTLILIGVLLATNASIYLIMANYNSYQLSTEIQHMLGSIGSSEWLYEQDSHSSTEDNDEERSHDEDAPYKLVNLPTAKELVIPQTLSTFQFYMIFNAQDQLIQQKSDNAVIFDKLLTQSKNLPVSGAPTVVSLQGSPELHYLIGKMPIVIENQTLGYYAVARDVTVAFETIDNLLKILAISFVAGILVSAVLGYFLAGRSLRPIKEAYHSKQTFLANASHELKTPLSVIMLSAEVLVDEMPPENDFQRQTVADIQEEAVKMSDLVNHLLLLARSDSSNLLSNKAPFNISELLTDEVARLQKIAQAKSIALTSNIATNVKYTGDKKLIQSLFSILIDNAIKYTPNGGQVSVTLEKSESLTHHQGIECRIKDTGIGIPAHELDKIFERFYRVDASRSKETGGYGLGLAIAKDIVTQHGGTIHATSVVGEGTEFVVRLR